jgi:hypothetical protein
MANHDEFALASCEGDVEKFAGTVPAMRAAKHRPREIAGDGTIDNHHVALLSLETMNCPDPDAIGQLRLMGEVFESRT